MKHTKKILAVLSAAAIAASMSAPAFAADTPKDAVEEIPPVIETLQIGDNVYLLNVELLRDGISCIMMETETRAREEISTRGDPYQTSEKTFNYRYSDKNGNQIGTANVTVYGVFSQVGGTSEMTDVSVSFSGSQQNSFDSTVNLHKNTAMVRIYYENVLLATYHYKIATNGTIGYA